MCSDKASPLVCRQSWRRRYLVLVLGLVALAVAVALVVLVTRRQLNGDGALVPPDPELPQSPLRSQLHRFAKAAVCSDGAPCSAVGRDILAQNGSVIDAAVATLLCNGVVNCQSMGLGGGFLMTLYIQQNNTAITLDARESAPAKLNLKVFENDPSKIRNGPLSVGIPGELKGYWEAHKRYGLLPWKTVVTPALEICEQGYNMTKHQSDSLSMSNKIWNDETLRNVFTNPKTGSAYHTGDLVRHGKLCDTLRIVAEKGGDELYTGSLAKMLAADVEELGGVLSEEDLNSYNVRWMKPVSVKLQSGNTVYSVPPPGSGPVLAFILSILDGYNLTRASVSSINNTVHTYHLITEAFKFAFAERTGLGDPDFVNVTELVDHLTSPEFASEIRHKIQENSTWQDPKKYGAIYFNQEDHGTAHISIIAPNGDAVSVTSTINFYFGAGFASKQTGIILNNGMDDFSLPFAENYFGLPGSPANTLEPGKRPLSSMCPAIVVDESNDVKLVIGASGGTKITTATAYVIMRHLWFGENIKQAVDASRFHHQLHPMEISYEYGVIEPVLEGLRAMGHNATRYNHRGSIVCAVSKQKNGIYANADYRKGGEVFGIN